MIRPDSAEAYRWYGRIYFRYGRSLEQAGEDQLPALNQSIELHRKADFLLLTNAGAADFADAMSYCENGAKFGPDMDFAQVNLGAFYTNMAEFLAREWEGFS